MHTLEDSKKLLVGKINGFFGVQGWVKIFSHTDPRSNIFAYQPWHIYQNKTWQVLKYGAHRVQSKTLVAQIRGFESREQALVLMGAELYIDKTQLPKLTTGQHYWRDLIGLEVINTLDVSLGHVVNLVDTGANHVLIVGDNAQNKEHWIAYIAPYLIAVNLDERVIRVDWDADF